MDYKNFESEIQKLIACYEKIDDESYCEIESAATESRVKEIEEKLNVTLPSQIREFFTQFSERVEFRAFLPDDFCDKLPDELAEIFSARFVISLDEVECSEENRRDWVEICFSNPEDDYDKVWHNKIGFMEVGNGDIIALDTEVNAKNPPVVYLSHDDGEGHGVLLGKDFNAFITGLVKIGGCGNEDWQMLPFIMDNENGINPDCENAKKYRELISFDI